MLEALLEGLNHDQAAVRLDVARVLGMLDETRALDALRRRYRLEPDTDVRAVIGWAGRRIYEAQQAGYDTLNALYRYFNVDRELAQAQDEAEIAMLRQLEQGLDNDLRRQLEDAGKRRMGFTLAASLGGTLLAGPLGGLTAARMAMGSGALDASSGFDPRPHIGTQRTPATRPTSDEISVWVRRLRGSLAPAAREQAALELAHLNNPVALPYLAAAFALDPADKVRDAAQRAGKVLYWSALYWAMEQDGSLAAEIERRAAALRDALAAERAASGAPRAAPGAEPAPDPQTDVSEILRRAQLERARRKRK